MDGIMAHYWAQKIREAYEQSHWNDQAGRVFGSEDISRMTRDLADLGAAGDQAGEFAREVRRLL